MHVAIAGSSGFLGSRLTAHLASDGHTVTRLVRRTAQPGERQWDPYAGTPPPSLLDDVDVVVNLAGAPTLGNPHSRAWARELESSRVRTTQALAQAIAASEQPPAFLAGNAIAWYGDHGDEVVDETSESRGENFMTTVTRHWQEAAAPAVEAGARVVVLRTPAVLDAHNPPLAQQALLFRCGLGGPIGDGRQYFPCVSTDDWVGAAAHLIHSPLSGPVNMCLPQVPTNGEFTRALAAAVHRPAIFRVPAPVVRVAAGRIAPEVLGSVRARPTALLSDGYAFKDQTVEHLLNRVLG